MSTAPTTQYITVSIFANDMSATAPTNGFAIEFASSAWNTGLAATWAAPAQPTAAVLPNTQGAGKLAVGLALGLFGTSLY